MNYTIVDGSDSMKTEEIARLLKMTYWADKRPSEIIEKSVRNSSCYGIRPENGGPLIGFARVVSDYATTWYLCDVIIDPEYAHGLYRKFGYEVVNDRVMVKAPVSKPDQ